MIGFVATIGTSLDEFAGDVRAILDLKLNEKLILLSSTKLIRNHNPEDPASSFYLSKEGNNSSLT